MNESAFGSIIAFMRVGVVVEYCVGTVGSADILGESDGRGEFVGYLQFVKIYYCKN